MTEEDFVALVKRAEQEVENNTRHYKVKLFLFAVLGYVVIFSLLFTLLFLIAGSLAAAFYSSAFLVLLLKKKLIIVLVVMAWVLIKSLWVRFEKPDGFELTRRDFSQLYADIDNLRDRLAALPIHKVILTPEFNAAVVQTPRLGVFGWQHNTLIVGLELLMVLSVDEARAVVAHELGHLSHNHSRFAGWIYRARISWDKIMHAFDDKTGLGAALTKKFFYWYAPHFAAYSFALARNNEYEADAMSARLTSPQDAAGALVNTHVTAPYVNDNYWRLFFKKADELQQPEQMPWVGLSRFLSDTSQSRTDIIDRVNAQMQEQSAYHDTHPSLSDRLSALGSEPVLPKAVEETAAQRWLGDRFMDVVGEFDRSWWRAVEERWQERFEYASECKQKLAAYTVSEAELNDEELWDYANLAYEFKGPDDALPLFEAFHRRHPQDSRAAYALGVVLFDKEDPACIAQFDAAFADPEYAAQAAQMAYDFVSRHASEADAKLWEDRVREQMHLDEQAQAERSQVTDKDTLQKPNIDPEQLDALARQLKSITLVRSAWLAQKVVAHRPEDPVYVLTFKTSWTRLRFSWESEIKSVLVSLNVPYHLFVIAHGGDYKALSKKVIKTGTRIV